MFKCSQSSLYPVYFDSNQVGRVGRADNIGLAISIVATTKEKVWYHKNCQNRGRGCANTKLVENGGCCIWYDEPSYLAAIEERVGSKIPIMNPVDFSVEGWWRGFRSNDYCDYLSVVSLLQFGLNIFSCGWFCLI